jgi:hypothetical protein
MEKELFSILRGENMLALGNKIKCMEKASSTILIIKSHTKAIGKTINYQVMGFYTMKK